MTQTITKVKQKIKHDNGKSTRKFHDPMAPSWTENYSDLIEKYWKKLPSSIASIIVFIAVFIFGATVRGKLCNRTKHQNNFVRIPMFSLFT